MDRLRYYLGVSVLLAHTCAAAAFAQPVAPQPATLASCDSSSGDPAPDAPDSTETVKRLLDCGYALNTESEYRRAQAVFERAAEMARRLEDQKGLASALAGSGMIFRTLGQGDRAEPLLRQSLEISEAIEDKDGMAYAFGQLGRLRNMQASYEEARDYHWRNFELSSEIEDHLGAAVAINNVGAMHRALGDYVTALEHYQRSLDGLERLGDRRRSATVIDNMALVARHVGDYPLGLELAQKALSIREELNDRLGIAHSLDTMSRFHRAEGNYAAALDAMQKSLAIRSALEAAHGVAEALNNLAAVYVEQGSYTHAVEYLHKALALNEKVGSRSLVADIQTHLGTVYFLQGQYGPARRALERSLAISQPLGYKSHAADALFALGRLQMAQGQLTAGDRSLRSCLDLRLALGDQRGRAETLIELAELDRRRGRHDAGLELAAEAERLARAMELPEAQWRALTVRGRLDRAKGRRGEARRAFDEAIALIEDLRFQVAGGDDTRSQFLADRLAPYRERIALALADGQTDEAFHFAERSKARALLDVIGSDRRPIAGAMTGEERTRERELQTRLASLNGQVLLLAQAAARDEARLGAAKRRRDATRLEYEDFLTMVYAAHPELRAQRAAVPVVRAREARQLLSDPSSAIVEFVAGPERTWAFVITGSDLKAFELPVPTATLAQEVARFRDQLANRDLRTPETARALHDLVLGPLRAAFRDVTDLTIVPDGVLWELPFQALQSAGNRYVIEDAAVSYAPSVTVLREMMRLGAGASPDANVLAFGNPTFGREARERRATVLMDDRLEPLPEAEAQVNEVARIYGPTSRVYVGAEAHEERWKADAERYGILHLATHGVVDNRSPLYSYVVLAAPGAESREDGLVEAWEVMNLRLQAKLVVLSACETARGRVSAGEGVIGLMWAFFVAGSSSTLVTQWKVESASSTELMVAFHTQWNAGRNDVTKARALQRASLQLLRSDRYAHPFYWAGYVLVGDRR